MSVNKQKKIEIILVTGFLGSGKTTLINRLIEKYRSKKIALIVNDFGAIAVDGILLKKVVDEPIDDFMPIYEIANGSIFCSCLSSELVKSLKYYAEINPDILIVETSGLSDPSTFETILKENMLESFFDIKASICIVDAIKTIKLADKIVAIEKQIVSSNIIVINKTDLISADAYEETVKFIRNHNEDSLIVKTVYSDFDLSLLDGKRKSNYSRQLESCNTVNSRPGSIVLDANHKSIEEIEADYQKIKNHILRIKGFLNIESELYYVSDNNNKLLFEKSEHKVKQLGLSVLLSSEKIETVTNLWR